MAFGAEFLFLVQERLLVQSPSQAILEQRVSPTDAELASDAALDHWLLHNVI